MSPPVPASRVCLCVWMTSEFVCVCMSWSEELRVQRGSAWLGWAGGGGRGGGRRRGEWSSGGMFTRLHGERAQRDSAQSRGTEPLSFPAPLAPEQGHSGQGPLPPPQLRSRAPLRLNGSCLSELTPRSPGGLLGSKPVGGGRSDREPGAEKVLPEVWEGEKEAEELGRRPAEPSPRGTPPNHHAVPGGQCQIRAGGAGSWGEGRGQPGPAPSLAGCPATSEESLALTAWCPEDGQGPVGLVLGVVLLGARGSQG